MNFVNRMTAGVLVGMLAAVVPAQAREADRVGGAGAIGAVEETEVIDVIEVVEEPEAAETGPNVSGESQASDRRQIFKDTAVRIEVPMSSTGGPQRPVRGLSRTEKMEMDDLEYRFSQGLIGEAEYYSRRNAIMQRIGLDPEY